MSLPIVSSNIVSGRIGVDWSIGRYDIKTRPAELSVSTIPTTISAPTRFATMEIDMSKAKEALYGGEPLALFKKLQGQMSGHAVQAIQSAVRKWNQIGNVADGSNPIPELAMRDSLKGGPDLQVFGKAAPNNIDISFNIPKPDPQIDVGSRDIKAQTYKPEIQYTRGSIDVYLTQRPNIDFQVRNLDVRV